MKSFEGILTWILGVKPKWNEGMSILTMKQIKGNFNFIGCGMLLLFKVCMITLNFAFQNVLLNKDIYNLYSWY